MSTPIGLWILERCASERFPYRLQILKGQEPWLILRVQDRWPTANRNIFCLREKRPPAPGEVQQEIERVPLLALQRRGRRVSVILARTRYKRCDFLFLAKPSKGQPPKAYEQIFWQTQQSLRQRRPRVGLMRTRHRSAGIPMAVRPSGTRSVGPSRPARRDHRLLYSR